MRQNVLLTVLVNYFALRHYTKTVVLLDCSCNQDYAIFIKSLADQGYSVLNLPMNANGTESFKIIKNSTASTGSVGILFNVDCPAAVEFINTCSGKQCFTEKYKWLMVEENTLIKNSNLLNALRTADIFVNAELAYLNLLESFNWSNGSIRIHRLYYIGNNAFSLGGRFRISLSGELFIDQKNIILHIIGESSYKNRGNMSDITLRIGFVLPNPDRFPSNELRIAHLLSDNNTDVDKLTRFTANAFMPVAHMLGSKTVYKVFGKWTDNETSGGALQSIIDNDADVLFCTMVLNTQRFPFYTPVIQFLELRTYFFFRTSSDVNIFQSDFLKPFETNVWIGLIIVIVFISILMKIIITYQPRVNRITVHERFSCTLIITYGAFCLQGAHFSPSLSSGRILFISLFFLGILIYNYYTSLLVSTLVQTTSRNKIKTLKDLADSNLDIAFDDAIYMRSFLRTTTEPQLRYFVDQKIKLYNDTDFQNGTFLSTADGFMKVKQQNRFAFHCDGWAGFPVIRDTLNSFELCDLNVILFRDNELLGFVIPKLSPLKHVIASKTFWIRETGIFSKHRKQWINEQPTCSYSSIFLEVGLEYIAGMFTFLLFFYLIAILLLICENIHFYFNRIHNIQRH